MPTIIFVIALFIRVFYVVNFSPMLTGDAIDYHRLAVSLSEGKGYVTPEGRPTSWRPPLYPFFISLIYRLGGDSYFLLSLIQSIIWSITCVVIYFIGSACFDYRIGIISGLMSTLYLGFIRPAGLLLSETLFTLFIAIVVLCLLRVREKASLIRLIIIGVMLAAASLTKAITLLLPLFILALFVINKVVPFRRSISYFLIILSVMLLAIAPWTIRNYIVHGAFVPISNQGGITLYSSYRPPEGKIFGQITNDETTARAYKIKSEAERSNFLYKETVNFIIHNPREVLKLSFLKAAFFFSPFDWEIVGEEGAYNFGYVFFAIFAVIGAYFAFKQKINNINYLILPLAYFLFISVVTQGCPRYRLITEPYLIILAGFGLSTLYKKVKNRYLATAITLFILFSNYLIYLNGGSFKLWARGIFQQFGLW